MPNSSSKIQPALEDSGAQSFEAAVLAAQLESSPDGIVVFAPGRGVLTINRRFGQMWGLDDEQMRVKEVVPSRRQYIRDQIVDPEGFDRDLDELYADQDMVERRRLVHLVDGRIFERYSAPVRGAEGEYLGRLLQYRDITEQHRIQAELRESEEQFRRTFEHSGIGMAHVSLEGRWLAVNPALCEMLGYTEDELRAKTFQEITHPDDFEEDAALTDQLARGAIDHYHFEKRYIHKSGDIVWTLLTGSAVPDEETGRARYFIAQVQDISERRKLEEQLRYQAHHDALTGLLNRTGFEVQLDKMKAFSAECDSNPAMLLIDLDRFKEVNDRHGHEGGDDLLRELAARLRQCVREDDIVARLGGDEFVILLPSTEDSDTPYQVASRIESEISKGVLVGHVQVHVAASVGVAIAEPGEDRWRLLRRADQAMYARKWHASGSVHSNGRNSS